MDKFKLMQILPSLQSGGVEQGTLDLANYLASQKIKNFIISNGGQMLSYLDKEYVDHKKLSVHKKNFFLMPFVAKKINKLLQNYDINILHIRSRAPAWLLPYINKKNIKTVSTFHNIYGNQNLIKKMYNKQLSNVDKIVAISNYVKKEIVKIYNINDNKITVINRGIDVDFLNGNINNQINFINFLKKYNIDREKKIILFPGRLTSWKGQIEFLKVVEFFKDHPLVFYFVGDDKNKSYLKKLIKEINNRKLNFNCKILGHLNKDEIKMMIKSSHIVVSAPLKPEGFGRIISESLSMKKIILAFNFGGAKDQLSSLDDIYKIKPADYKELISKIDIVLKYKEDHIFKMGEYARKHIVNNFSKKNMVESYLNFYREL